MAGGWGPVGGGLRSCCSCAACCAVAALRLHACKHLWAAAGSERASWLCEGRGDRVRCDGPFSSLSGALHCTWALHLDTLQVPCAWHRHRLHV